MTQTPTDHVSAIDDWPAMFSRHPPFGLLLSLAVILCALIVWIPHPRTADEVSKKQLARDDARPTVRAHSYGPGASSPGPPCAGQSVTAPRGVRSAWRAAIRRSRSGAHGHTQRVSREKGIEIALVPVHMTLMNGLDEVMVHQGEIVADAVRRLEIDAVIDTRYLAGPNGLARR